MVLLLLKGTVNIISSDPLGKDWYMRFIVLPFKALSDQVLIRNPCFRFGSS